MANPKVEIHNKLCLTVEECAALFNVGVNTLRKLIESNPDAPYLLRVGKKNLFKKKLFEEFLEGTKELIEKE